MLVVTLVSLVPSYYSYVRPELRFVYLLRGLQICFETTSTDPGGKHIGSTSRLRLGLITIHDISRKNLPRL
jgi:hypothetical protein